MTRRFLASLCVTAMGFVLALQAAEPARPDAKKNDADQVRDEAKLKQDQLKRQYEDFKKALLIVKGNLENGSQADKEKAKLLDNVLNEASKQGIEAKFLTLLDGLKKEDAFKNIEVVTELIRKNEEVRSDLKNLIRLLQSDSDDDKLTEERKRVEALLERIRDLIAQEKRQITNTEMNRLTEAALKKAQEDIRKNTERLNKGEGKAPDKNDPKNTPKGEGKTPGAEGKDNGKAQAKEDTKGNKGDNKPEAGKGKENEGKEGKEGKDNKIGENKEGKDNKNNPGAEGKDGKGAENKDSKAGEGKENKGTEGKEGKAGENKDSKGNENKEGKTGEGKGNESKESKEAKAGGAEGKESKSGEAKSGEGKEGKGGEGKSGENKEGKGGEGKGGEGKGNESKDASGGEGKEGKGGEGKGGEGKEGKGGEGKSGENKDSKGGEAKAGSGKEAGKGGESKPGEGKEGKPGEPKEGKPGSGKGDPKAGTPGDPKGGDPKGNGEAKSGKPGDASKGGEAKSGSGDPKGGEPKGGKPGEAKGGESKGKGDGKGDGKAGDPKSGKPGGGESKAGQSKGSPSSGQPGQPGQQGQAKGDPSSGSPGKPGQQQPSEAAQVKKQIEDSIKYQKGAEKKLEEPGKRADAVEDEENAERKLEEAQRKLEDLLAQLREEERERLLGKLEGRVRYMLDLQKEVKESTVGLHGKYGSKKLDEVEKRALGQASDVQGDKEHEIVQEADKAIDLIRAEGSAVAFAKVFEQVRKDMTIVEGNLKRSDVAEVTQTIESDIIATLEEMLDALKKAQPKPDPKKKPPMPPGQPPPPQQPQDQKLIDSLAELKMIRSMQERINSRTEVYAKPYTTDSTGKPKVEQIPQPDSVANPEERKKLTEVHAQLKDLGGRQEELSKVAGDISKGKNEKR